MKCNQAISCYSENVDTVFFEHFVGKIFPFSGFQSRNKRWKIARDQRCGCLLHQDQCDSDCPSDTEPGTEPPARV